MTNGWFCRLAAEIILLARSLCVSDSPTHTHSITTSTAQRCIVLLRRATTGRLHTDTGTHTKLRIGGGGQWLKIHIAHNIYKPGYGL